MQTNLFDSVAAPVRTARPRRPVPLPRDDKAQYEGLQEDLDHLAEDWEDLHVKVLQRHLRLLASPHTEDRERVDILAWLEAPLVRDRPAAFSAQACLAIYDARIDPVEFQRRVRRLNQSIADRPPARAA